MNDNETATITAADTLPPHRIGIWLDEDGRPMSAEEPTTDLQWKSLFNLRQRYRDMDELSRDARWKDLFRWDFNRLDGGWDREDPPNHFPDETVGAAIAAVLDSEASEARRIVWQFEDEDGKVLLSHFIDRYRADWSEPGWSREHKAMPRTWDLTHDGTVEPAWFPGGEVFTESLRRLKHALLGDPLGGWNSVAVYDLLNWDFTHVDGRMPECRCSISGSFVADHVAGIVGRSVQTAPVSFHAISWQYRAYDGFVLSSGRIAPDADDA